MSTVSSTKVDELFGQVRDALTVKRVFGDPVERDGTTVLPVARVRGGWGGGGGDQQPGNGWGGGGGVVAEAAGIFVIRDGRVEWRPALNIGRIILGMQVALALVGMAYFRARRRCTD